MQEQNSAPQQTTPEEVKVQAKNFAELRSIAESAKQENLQLKLRLSQLEESLKKDPKKEPEFDDSDPYIDQNRFKHEMSKFKESVDETIDKKAAEKARAILEEERRNEYLAQNKDFYEVMQEGELQKFVSEFPNIAAGLQKMPDTFDRQKLVYETLKTFKGMKPQQPQTPPTQKSALAQAFDARKASVAYTPGGSAGGPFQSIGDFSPGGMKNAYERFKSLQKTVNI